jgi:dCTP deaminase
MDGMGVKPDRWIVEMAQNHEMIRPFSETQVRNGISYGPSSYGYDISLSDEFKLFDPSGTDVIDPRDHSPEMFTDIRAESVIIPANSYALGRSREYFKIPRNIIAVCFGKSTYARSGLIVNVTPFEPEWEGFATISLSNTAPVPIRVYANQGIAQLLFLEANDLCEISYKDRQGKYQGQKKITLSKSD